MALFFARKFFRLGAGVAGIPSAKFSPAAHPARKHP